MTYTICSLLDTFAFTLAEADNPTNALVYTSTDEFLNGNGVTSSGFLFDSYTFGKLNLYYHTPYAKCDPRSQTATLYVRSGDNAIGNPQPDGSAYNTVGISRSEYTFEKAGNRKNKEWKLKSSYILATIYQIIYVPPSTDNT